MNNQDTCPVCEARESVRMPGSCRDAKDVYPIKCSVCGHIRLSSLAGSDKEHFKSGNWAPSKNIARQLLKNMTDADTARRYKDFQKYIDGMDILDFGSGNGNFLNLAAGRARSVTGLDLDRRHAENYVRMNIPFYMDLDSLPSQARFDLITMFHVLDHISEPYLILEKLRSRLSKNGVLLIETPNADDALISLFKCPAFSDFNYYASHIFVYSYESLKRLLQKSFYKIIKISGIQRYPLANHLYWLSQGKPGGQYVYKEFNDPVLQEAYSRALRENGISDTLLAICSPQ